jgi:hypothetical protein
VRRKAVHPAAVPSLAKGQLWKLKHAYIYVVDLGKRMIRFKLMTSPKARFERTLTGEADTLWGYLKQRHAELVNT